MLKADILYIGHTLIGHSLFFAAVTVIPAVKHNPIFGVG